MSSVPKKRLKPLVYSCSGCSSAAQMANRIALDLDRSQLADMSCIAGVGGGVKSLVRVAKAGRPIIALDGCVLKCVVACLGRHEVKPDVHFTLSDFGVEKQNHVDFDPLKAQAILEDIKASDEFKNLMGTIDEEGEEAG